MPLSHPPRHRLPSRRAQGGFTLVEVLVSVLVVALGLLGLAGLHVASLKNTRTATQRGEITYLAYEMADRMRANRGGVDAGAYNNATANTRDCIANSCSPADLAGSDLAKWRADLASRLPDGRGVVCLDATPDDGTPDSPGCDGAGTTYAIKIWWDEGRTGQSADYRRFVVSLMP